MNKKIASLFASVGFNIDTTDLNKLDGHLKTIRGNTANLSRNLRVVNTQLNTTSSRMRNLAKAAEAVTKFNNLGGKYVTLAVKVKEAEGAIARFGRVLKLIEPRLDSTNFRLSTTVRSYQDLAAAVREANRELSRTPNRPPRPISPLGGGRGNGGAGGSGSGQGGGAGAGFLGGLLGAVGRFTPAGMLGGSAVTGAAVGVNEVRKAGQDIQRMENMLLFSTNAKDAAGAQLEYARNLEFVRKESLRLGLDTAELGKAFAQVNMSAGDKMSEDARKKMFTDMSEYIMVTGAGQEDQKLIFKAVNQMFSLGRIMAEEMNQLTERGVPRQQLYDIAKTKYGVTDTAAVMDLQKKGKLKPEDLLPLLFEQFAKKSRDTGAFAKMLESSIFKQNQFKVALKQMSSDIMNAGLDKALGTFFEALTVGIPHMLAFLKGLGGVFKGLSEIVKIVWNAVEAWGNFVAANSQLVLNFSVLLGLLAMSIVRVTGATLAFGRFGLLLATLGRRIPLIAMLLALFYLFKEYDRYMKGEDSWMANFADWMIYLAESTRLFKEELIGTFNAIKEFRIGDAFSNGLVQDTNNGFMNVNPIKRLIDKAKDITGVGIPTKQTAMIPYANAPSSQPSTNYSGKLMGEVDIKVTVDQNGKMTRQPVQRVPLINQGSLRP